MLSRLLNKTVIIKRYDNTSNDSGDMSNAKINVATGIKIRITTNKKVSNDTLGDSGFYSASTHLGFCYMNDLIKKDMFVVDGTKEYKIDYVDVNPGGSLSSHYQLYMTEVS